jgi:hypothetical protein
MKNLMNLVRGATLAFGLATMTGALASDVRDGNAMVVPEKGARYSIDGSTMGKAELFGYISDLKDREHVTGLVLKRGGDDEQRHVIGSIARTLQLKAFEQDGRNLKPIDLPAAAPTPPPPPIDGQPTTNPAAGSTQPAH